MRPEQNTRSTGVYMTVDHRTISGVTQRDSIGVYSFACKPEEYQPSGTCNFSRIDNAQFIYPAQDEVTGSGSLLHAVTMSRGALLTSKEGLKEGPGGIIMYAVNYNVLRIMSGMGGLAYSN